MGGDGLPWIIDKDNGLEQRLPNDTWQVIGGCSQDVALAADNALWVVGCDDMEDGFSIYKLDKNTNSWSLIAGAATRMAALNEVSCIKVDKTGKIMKTVFSA